MKASPLDLQGKGAIIQQQQTPLLDPFSFFLWSGTKEGPEPRSVLDHIRSPSPPSSTSTLSSSSALAALSDSNAPPWPPSSDKDWASDLPSLDPHKSLDDWEAMLEPPTTTNATNPSLLRWIMSDLDEPPKPLMPLPDPDAFPVIDAAPFGLDQIGAASNGKSPLLYPSDPAFLPAPPGGFFLQEPPDEKPQLFAPNFLLHQQQNQFQSQNQNSSFFLPFPPFAILDPPPAPQQQLMVPPSAQRNRDPFHHGLGAVQAFPFPALQRHTAKSRPPADDQQQNQEILDQLYKAAELIEGGNFVSAQGILARLNHQLSPVGKPLVRSAFYFKEALTATAAPSVPKPPSTPLDVVLKISAYKGFSEISPVLQFTNFTCVQTLLEEFAGCDRIHILDFDIGFGGQWSSFMQELSQWRAAAGSISVASLKITAFVSPSSYHPLELALTRDNLVHFASDLGIPFEFNFLSLDSFDPAALVLPNRGNEAIAVSIPIGSSHPSTPGLLRCLKQLSPKIVISVDHGCDRCDLSFSQHFLNLLQSYTLLLESIDAAGANLDATNKIERLLLQPRIEGAVLGRYRATDKMVPWRAMFASAGFVPVQFSNFTETQAECLLKRVQVRGFHAEKRQSSLVLFWQRGELASVSAWRC